MVISSCQHKYQLKCWWKIRNYDNNQSNNLTTPWPRNLAADCFRDILTEREALWERKLGTKSYRKVWENELGQIWDIHLPLMDNLWWQLHEMTITRKQQLEPNSDRWGELIWERLLQIWFLSICIPEASPKKRYASFLYITAPKVGKSRAMLFNPAFLITITKLQMLIWPHCVDCRG